MAAFACYARLIATIIATIIANRRTWISIDAPLMARVATVANNPSLKGTTHSKNIRLRWVRRTTRLFPHS